MFVCAKGSVSEVVWTGFYIPDFVIDMPASETQIPELFSLISVSPLVKFVEYPDFLHPQKHSSFTLFDWFCDFQFFWRKAHAPRNTQRMRSGNG